jgi:hypothetical protein
MFITPLSLFIVCEIRAVNATGRMALRVKIGPEQADPKGFGGSKAEDENDVWPDFRCNPSGRGQFS